MQWLKAYSPILATLFGMLMEVRFSQYQKAEQPISLRLLEMVTEVRFLQLANAAHPIFVTPCSIIILFILFLDLVI